MKTRNILSAVLLMVGFLTTSVAFGQSCDTLRNYNPSDQSYELSIPPTNDQLVLGHMTGSDNVDTYNLDEWAEKYTVPSATQVRAVRMAPWKVQNGSGSATLTIQVYNDGGTEPGAVIGSQIVSYDDFTENFWHTVEFDNPVNVSGSFYVGYKLSFTNYPQDLFAISGTQPVSGFTKVHASTVGGGTGTFDGWDDVGGWVSSGGNPAQIAFVFDVLLSTDPVPVPSFTGDNAEACVSGAFTGLDASSTTGSADVYEWWLTDDAYTTIYTDDFGVTTTLNPTTSSPSAQRIYLWVDGACVTRGVYSTVTVNPDVTATVVTVDPTCANTDGQISITASGGDGVYLYSINGGSTTSSSGIFSNLASGNYNIQVTSGGNGCTYSQTFTLVDPIPEVITMGNDQTICEGNSATLTASGNGTIEWFDGATSLGNGTSKSVSPTSDKTYTAVLTDGNNCTDSKTVNVTVNPLPTFTLISTDPSTCNGNDGEITISGLDNNTAYSVSYTAYGSPVGPISMTSNGIGNIIITGLNQGTYSDFSVDLGGCVGTVTTTITLVDPSAPTFTLSSANPTTCGGLDGEITISGLNASTAYLISYSDGSPVGPTSMTSNASGEIAITGLNAGSYSNFSVDLGGCVGTVTTTITLVDPSAPTFTLSSSDPTTCGGNDGVITISGLDASTAYLISYNDGSPVGPLNMTSNASGEIVITGLNAGSYNNFKANLGGCIGSVSTSITLVDPSAPTFTLSSVNPTSCGGTDGEIIINGLDASTAYLISYNDGSPVGPTNMTSNGSGEIVITGLNAGSYSNFKANLGGCIGSVSTTITLVDPSAPTFTLSSVNPTSCGGTDGEIIINGLDASTAYDISYNDGSPVGPTNMTSNASGEIVITGLNQGTYSDFSVDLGGCVGTVTTTIILVDPSAPTFTLNSSDPTSCGGTDGEITIGGLDASTAYLISYNAVTIVGPLSMTSDASGEIVITGLSAGNYSNFSVDLGGCVGTVTTTITLVDPSAPTFTLIPTNPSTCGGNDGIITIHGLDNNTAYDISYNDGSPVGPLSMTSNASGEIVITGLNAGVYNNISVDLGGCVGTEANGITLVDPALPIVNAGQNQTACVTDNVLSLSGSPAGGTFSGAGVSGNDFNPSVAGEGTFTITYTYTDANNGCTNSATLEITVDGCVGLIENEINSVTISPNPASEYIQVTVGENNSIETVQIISIEGQTIAVDSTKVDSYTTKINVSSIVKGVYFIRLTTEKGQFVKKIVIQ